MTEIYHEIISHVQKDMSSRVYAVSNKLDISTGADGNTIQSRWTCYNHRVAKVLTFEPPVRQIWSSEHAPVFDIGSNVRAYYYHSLHIFRNHFGRKIIESQELFGLFVILTNILWNQGGGSQAKVQQVFHTFEKKSYVRGLLPVFPDKHFPIESLLAIGQSVLMTARMSFPDQNHVHLPNAPHNSWTIGQALREIMEAYHVSDLSQMHREYEEGEPLPFTSDYLEFQSERSLEFAKHANKRPFQNAEFLEYYSKCGGGSSELLCHGRTIGEILVGNYVTIKKFLQGSPDYSIDFAKNTLDLEAHQFRDAKAIWEGMDRNHFDGSDTVRTSFCDAQEQSASFRMYDVAFFKIPKNGRVLPELAQNSHVGSFPYIPKSSGDQILELPDIVLTPRKFLYILCPKNFYI